MKKKKINPDTTETPKDQPEIIPHIDPEEPTVPEEYPDNPPEQNPYEAPPYEIPIPPETP